MFSWSNQVSNDLQQWFQKKRLTNRTWCWRAKKNKKLIEPKLRRNNYSKSTKNNWKTMKNRVNRQKKMTQKHHLCRIARWSFSIPNEVPRESKSWFPSPPLPHPAQPGHPDQHHTKNHLFPTRIYITWSFQNVFVLGTVLISSRSDHKSWSYDPKWWPTPRTLFP